MRSISVCSQFLEGFEVFKCLINNHKFYAALITSDAVKFKKSREYDDVVLVRKLAFSLNFRDRSLIFRAAQHIQKGNLSSAHFPIGSEYVGIIEAKGKNVTGLKIGDLVIPEISYPTALFQGLTPGIATNTASKEFELFHYGKVSKIPVEVPIEVAAGFVIGAQTSYSMIRKAELSQGDHVLVTSGSSNTSLFLINGLRKKNVHVSVLTTNGSNEQKFKSMGCENVFVINDSSRIERCNEFLKYSRLISGFNAILDPMSDIHLKTLINHMKFGARFITCGIYNQIPPFTPTDTVLSGMMVALIKKNLSIIGNCIGVQQDIKDALEDYINGDLPVNIDSVFTERDILPFLNRTYNEPKFGKVIMRYN